MKITKMPKDVIEFFRATGKQGGETRAAKYTKEQLSAWGKMGGRPKGSGKKKKKKKKKKGGK